MKYYYEIYVNNQLVSRTEISEAAAKLAREEEKEGVRIIASEIELGCYEKY